jgi:hypothetical protein
MAQYIKRLSKNIKQILDTENIAQPKLQIYSVPVHYEDENGELQDIVLNAENIQTWETDKAFEKNNFKAYFNDTTDDDNFALASFELKNKWINFKPVDANPDDIEVTEGKVKYINAYEDVDIEYLINSTKLKENIIIKSKDGIMPFYEFSIKKSSNIALRYNSDKTVSIVDTRGKEICKLQAPYMQDNSGAISHDVDYYVSEIDIDGVTYETILIVPDKDWLNSEFRTFPIVIDPTIAIDDEYYGESAQARKQQYDATGAWSDWSANNPAIYELLNGLSSGVWRAIYSVGLFEFVLDSSGINVTGATLYLHGRESSTLTGPATVNVRYNLSDWTGATITYDTKPSSTQIGTVSIPDGSFPSNEVTIDVTDIVSDWLDGITENYGFQVTQSSYHISQVSAFAYATESYRPYMEITYTVTAPTTAWVSPPSTDDENPTFINQVRPTIQFTYNQAGSMDLKYYEVEVYDLSDNLIFDSGNVVESSSSGDTVSYQLTEDLDYYTTYKVKVRTTATDPLVGDTTGSFSSFVYFQIQANAPSGITVTENATNKSLDVDWNESTEDNLYGYNLYRAKKNTDIVTLDLDSVINSGWTTSKGRMLQGTIYGLTVGNSVTVDITTAYTPVGSGGYLKPNTSTEVMAIQSTYSTSYQTMNVTNGDEIFIYGKVDEDTIQNAVGIQYDDDSVTTDVNSTTATNEAYGIVTVSSSGLVNPFLIDNNDSTTTSTIPISFITINKTNLGIESYTEAQMLDLVRQGYFDGVASVENLTLTSEGKNLINLLDTPVYEVTSPITRESETAKAIIRENNIIVGFSYDAYFATSPYIQSVSENKLTYYSGGAGYGIGFKVKVKPNTQYKLSVSSITGLVGIGKYRVDGSYIGSYNQTSVVDNDCAFLFVVFYSGTSGFFTVDNPQLEKGTTATTYEPYKSARLTINAELNSVPNGTTDEVDLATRTMTKKVEKYTLQSGDITALTNFTNVDIVALSDFTNQYKYENFVEVAPKLGSETRIYSLTTLNGKIYGGTDPNGKLYEWNGTNSWVEVAPKLGSETRIYSLTTLNGKIYGGTDPNGKLYEWNGTNSWVEVAPQLGSETRISSLTTLNGKIYGGTYPNGKLYEWNGTNSWVEVAPQLGSETRIYSLTTLNGKIYGGTYPNGKLYEWNGTNSWVEVAPKLGSETGIFSLTTLNGKIYGGTYPNGKLYEWNGTNSWVEVAPKLGSETGISSLTTLNGKIYGGTYSNGKLYEWNGTNSWVEVAPKLGSETSIFSLTTLNGKIYGGTYSNGKLYEISTLNQQFILDYPYKEFEDSTHNINTYISHPTSISLVVPSGTYADLAAAQADLAGTVVYYELATTEVLDNGDDGFVILEQEYIDGDWVQVDEFTEIFENGRVIQGSDTGIVSLESQVGYAEIDDFVKVNDSIIADTSYEDFAILSAQEYVYRVTNVTLSGESFLSNADFDDTTYTGFYLDELQIDVKRNDIITDIIAFEPTAHVLGKNYLNTQRMGYSGEQVGLTIQFKQNARSSMNEFLGVWKRSSELTLRSAYTGDVWIVRPIDSITSRRTFYKTIELSLKFIEIRRIEE